MKIDEMLCIYTRGIFAYLNAIPCVCCIHHACTCTITFTICYILNFTSFLLKLVFLESQCHDNEKIWENIRDAKIRSPDYVGWKEHDIMTVSNGYTGLV